MEPRDLALFCAQALSDKQADDVVILDVEKLVSYASYFIIASGRSDRQVRALVNHLERYAREHGLRALGTEGTERGVWALIDFGDVVIHVFRGEERYFYDLEGLWQDAPRLPFEPEAPAARQAAGR